jgi:hypothetical protein
MAIALNLSMQILQKVDNTTIDEEECIKQFVLYSCSLGLISSEELHDEVKELFSDVDETMWKLCELERKSIEEVIRLSSIDLKRSSIQFMIDTGHMLVEEEHAGNWKWWALIQWWAKLNSSLGIRDIGYSDTEDGVMPRRLSPPDKQWINKEFGEIYTKKDEDVIKTVLARNPEWKSLYLYIDNEKDELVKLCEELDRVFL